MSDISTRKLFEMVFTMDYPYNQFPDWDGTYFIFNNWLVLASIARPILLKRLAAIELEDKYQQLVIEQRQVIYEFCHTGKPLHPCRKEYLWDRRKELFKEIKQFILPSYSKQDWIRELHQQKEL